MKRKLILLGIFAMILIFGIMLIGCAKKYTVTFDIGRAGGTTPEKQIVPAGSVIQLPEQGDMIAPLGTYFRGWLDVYNDEGYKSGDYTVTDNVIFLANWDKLPSPVFNEIGSGKPTQEQQFIYFKKNIEGYYSIYDRSIRGYNVTHEHEEIHLAYVTIEGNNLFIYKFNVKNNQRIYEEVLNFDMTLNNSTKYDLSFENNGYTFIAEFLEDKIRYIRLIMDNSVLGTSNDEVEIEKVFAPIAPEMNDEVQKYTYDYQKPYTGTYIYDHDVILGTEEDKNTFDAAHFESFKNPIIINIDDDGYLYIADESGAPYYEGWKTKIIDETKRTMLFGNIPAYGTSIEISFINSEIIIEFNIEDKNTEELIYQLILKKQ